MKCNTERNKCETINVRVPSQEKQLITELAQKAGISPSDFVRMSLRSSLDLISRTAKLGVG